jgi:hypothetical protein
MSTPDMTAGSWTFMLVSWAILIAINLYCFSVMLRKGKKT